MENQSPTPDRNRPVIYLLSPRSGGPYHQLKLLARKLNEQGYTAKHCSTITDWVKLHFNRKDKVVSVVPFLFLRNHRNLVLNIRGNFNREKRLSNPLSYFYARNLKRARQVIVPSQYLKQELALNNAHVIPNSTDIPTPDPPTTSSTDPIRIATITNFDFRPKAQGITKLINLVNQLQTEQKLELHIYGGGRWLDYGREQYELHNFKKYPVYFHGAFTKAAEILPGNDIFIYWSIFDNMPNVLIEAAACGLPVVVNDYAAYSEIFGDNNLLAKNEEEFSRYILDLIENPDKRAQYREQNLTRAAQFDINQNIKSWLKAMQI